MLGLSSIATSCAQIALCMQVLLILPQPDSIVYREKATPMIDASTGLWVSEAARGLLEMRITPTPLGGDLLLIVEIVNPSDAPADLVPIDTSNVYLSFRKPNSSLETDLGYDFGRSEGYLAALHHNQLWQIPPRASVMRRILLPGFRRRKGPCELLQLILTRNYMGEGGQFRCFEMESAWVRLPRMAKPSN